MKSSCQHRRRVGDPGSVCAEENLCCLLWKEKDLVEKALTGKFWTKRRPVKKVKEILALDKEKSRTKSGILKLENQIESLKTVVWIWMYR